MPRHHAHVITTAVLAALIGANPGHAQPVIVEPGWTLIRTIEFENPIGAHYNPVDGLIYVTRYDTGSDGLYRISHLGLASKRASASRPSSLVIDHEDGDAFVSEGYGGNVFRTGFGTTGRETWVSGWHTGDDDPIGMAIAPSGYVGDVILPSEALVVDRGNSGPDEVWVWSPDVAEGEVVVHADDGTLVDPVDVTIGVADVYLVDGGGTGDGTIYRLDAGGVLTPIATSAPIADPYGITVDPLTGDLYVLDTALDRIVRVALAPEPDPAVVTDVVTGFAGLFWTGVDVTPDGRRLFVTDFGGGAIHVFARCEVLDPEDDCNENDVWDMCDVRLGTTDDCNLNGVPDTCDLDSGSSDDCNEDGIPDDCPVCPLVELIFVMDTSTSMNDEAAALCGSILAVVAQLQASGIDVDPLLLGISNNPSGIYGCLTDNVIALYGTAVPGSPPPGMETLGDCPGGTQVPEEDWGRAVAVVAGLHPWLEPPPDPASLRLIVPISDEGPWCGDPVTDVDDSSILHAIDVALDHHVIVSPITGTGSSASVIALAQQIATATGGNHFSSAQPDEDIAQGIIDIVVEACTGVSDCDGNGVLDECDLEQNPSLDCDGNGIIDACECLADVDGDGNVGFSDLLAVLSFWGPCPACSEDISCNGDVGFSDLLEVLSRWGPCP